MELGVERVIHSSLDLISLLVHELSQLPLDLIRLLDLVELGDQLQPHISPDIQPVTLVLLGLVGFEDIHAAHPVTHVFHEILYSSDNVVIEFGCEPASPAHESHTHPQRPAEVIRQGVDGLPPLPHTHVVVLSAGLDVFDRPDEILGGAALVLRPEVEHGHIIHNNGLSDRRVLPQLRQGITDIGEELCENGIHGVSSESGDPRVLVIFTDFGLGISRGLGYASALECRYCRS